MPPSSPSSDLGPRRPNVLIAWAFVALLAIVCAWLVQLCLALRAENTLLRQQQELAELELRSTRQHLEAERILNQHAARQKSPAHAP
jgi:hypothetical protein